MVIFTLGITLPLASTTVPVIELRAWPRRIAGDVRSARQTTKPAVNERQLMARARCNRESIEKILMYGSLPITSEIERSNLKQLGYSVLALGPALSGEGLLKF
jgi:hypothetical protein